MRIPCPLVLVVLSLCLFLTPLNAANEKEPPEPVLSLLSFPDEVLIEILKYLPGRELLQVMLVCHRFNRLVWDEGLLPVYRDGNGELMRSYRDPLLFEAARRGHLEAIRRELWRGVPINAQTILGETALRRAAENRQFEAIQLLLDRGADYGIADVDGFTPLEAMVYRGDEEVFRAFVAYSLEIAQWLWGLERAAVLIVMDAALRQPDDSPFITQALAVLDQAGGLFDRYGEERPLDPEDFDVQECFAKAIELGLFHVVQAFLDAGVDLDRFVDGGERPPLNIAAWFNHPELIRLMLDREADVRLADLVVGTALHYAAWEGHFEVAELIVDANPDLDAIDDEGNTPLLCAAWGGHTAIVRLLLQAGAATNIQNFEGETPLHYAAREGEVDVFLLLMEAGADFQVVDFRGRSPLHVAVINDRAEVVRALFNNRVVFDFLLQNIDQARALFRASIETNGFNSAVSKLLRAVLRAAQIPQLRGEPGYIDLTGMAIQECFLRAAGLGLVHLVDGFITANIDLDWANEGGITALHEAAAENRPVVVERLVLAGANLNPRVTEGFYTPLHVAAYEGFELIVALLLREGAAPGLPNAEGITPLHCAARNGHEGIVRLLLNAGAGAGVHAVTARGNTALSLAEMNGHESISLLLREYLDAVQTAADEIAPLIDVDDEIAHALSLEEIFASKALSAPKVEARMFTLNYF